MKSMMRTKTIPYKFGEKHIKYIRKCAKCEINVAEGAVRAGKTIDNVYAFAHEIKTAPDKIHLATGSTSANAKLNIGDANGFGLEWIFRGQCRWGKYKGNECLYIRGPDTGYRQRVVIFAGAAKADSFKKIRGNSYGMWIATEINLHHENTIKEAINRQLAAKRRKIFWDLNPDHPKATIYANHIDKYDRLASNGNILGGYNYEHFTIFDNVTISEERKQTIINEYDPTSIWYQRDILGKRCIAEGLIYRQFADEVGRSDKQNRFKIHSSKVPQLAKIIVGVDFGGTSSGHSFVATGITPGYERVYALASKREIGDDIDPDKLGDLFISFVQFVQRKYGSVSVVYCDSAEQVLIRGLQKSAQKAGISISIRNALKSEINNRINLTCRLMAQGRFFYTEDCETLEEAFCTAIWNPKILNKNVRLDDGTSDIDTLDGYEYTIERDARRFIRIE